MSDCNTEPLLKCYLPALLPKAPKPPVGCGLPKAPPCARPPNVGALDCWASDANEALYQRTQTAVVETRFQMFTRYRNIYDVL